MTTLLAIETSAEACSVAIALNDRVTELHEMLPRSHTEHVLPMVEKLLAQTGVSVGELDAIAFGRGPGSFTGLRVCAAVVQGLAFAFDTPVAPVSSLQALALTAVEHYRLEPPHDLLCCIDARMNEVYWAQYRLEASSLRLCGEEALDTPENVRWLETGRALAVGSGWRHAERMQCRPGIVVDAELLPRAGAVARLGLDKVRGGELVSADKAIPAYLREDVAWR